jgi:hypothetical protein
VRVQHAVNTQEREAYPTVLKAGCAKGAFNACAGALFLGTKAPSSTTKADLRKLCQTSLDSHACSFLGDLDTLDRGSNPKALREQRDLMQLSCDAHPGPACFILAQHKMLESGAMSEDAVLPLLERACAGGDASTCYELGQGFVGKKQLDRAHKAYQSACDLLWPEACYNLAWLEKDAGNTDAYARLSERACRLGDPKACDSRATEASAQGDKTANALYCRLWGAGACFAELAKLTGEGGETAEQAERIVELVLTACRRGHAGACRTFQHAIRDWTGNCASQDVKQHRNACALVGFVELHADLLPADARARLRLDRAHAVESLKASCAAGAQVACAAAERVRK